MNIPILTRRRRNRETLFSPMDLSPAIFLSSDMGVSDTGGAVDSWTGQEAAANVFSQTGTNRPVITSSVFGAKDGITFDGSDDYLKLSSNLLNGGTGSVFMVLKTESTLSRDCAFSSSDEDVAQTGMRLYSSFDVTNWYIASYERLSGNLADNIYGSTELSASTTYIMYWSSSSTSYAYRINGAAQTNTAIGGSDNGNWFAAGYSLADNVIIGGWEENGGIQQPFGGSIGAVIAYNDQILTLAEIMQVESWLNIWAGGGIL